MSKKKEYVCVDGCEAVFRITFDMDPDRYQITHCPFCGEELGPDRDNGWEIESDYED